MFKKLSGSSSSLWKPKNPHSLEYLRYLHGVLLKNEKVTDGNKALLVEALRSITEILIWGDQNDTSVFDFFLERQMLSHFLAIMKQKCGHHVNVQILQTLNIMFENIRHETSLYFLLSNNHVNSIISHKFDFDNEEICSYYISFLKTLSFKLNANTVHFFFNESTDEFPLFTEAIKFYNHPESMVRIAIRTLTLNTFKVRDASMEKFIVKRSEHYFDRVCIGIAEQLIDTDVFARSAQNESSNRCRLTEMVDIHLDSMHYINDILISGNNELNALLLSHLFKNVIGPLYLASLGELRSTYHPASTVLLTRVSALFFLTHFIIVVHEKSAVQILLTSLFFGDQNDIRTEWTRSVRQGLHVAPRPPMAKSELEERFFFRAHLKSLAVSCDDHACFFGLLFIYCIAQNQGVSPEMLEAAQVPCVNECTKCDPVLMENLVRMMENCAHYDTSLRPITIELCCIVLRRLLISLESDKLFQTAVEEAVNRTMQNLVQTLRNAVFAESLFLDMFEDEFYELQMHEIKLSTVSEDPALYLPPSNTPLGGVPFSRRLPSGKDERIRRTLQFYFLLRKFAFDLSGEEETVLPLSSNMKPMAEINDCINLNNSDLLACSVVSEKKEKLSRFLVTDQFQLILVEPDSKKLGWAVVRFVGLLQDTQITGDPSDSKLLHVVVEDAKCRAQKKPLLSAKFIFDDHIRCMAARQRLTKGRRNSRQYKLNLICDLFGIPSRPSSVSPVPASPAVGSTTSGSRGSNREPRSAPGSVHKITTPSSSHGRSFSPQIPDDPKVAKSPSTSNTKIHHV